VKRNFIDFAVPLAAGLVWISPTVTAAQSSHRPSTPALRHGQQAFSQYCSSCHSAHNSNSLVGPGLKGYYSTRQPRPKDSDVRAVITKGKGKMPSFGNLGTGRIDELIAYLRTL
jgi:mono/diheme cytochrome c family protein